MKKLIVHTLLIITISSLLTGYSFAEGADACKIRSEPAPELTRYFENVRNVIGNLNSSATAKEDTFKSVSEIKIGALKAYNKIINWDEHFGTFSFYAVMPLQTEIPREVKRDYKLIEDEIKFINRFLERSLNKGYGDAKIDTPCSGVSSKCELEGNFIEIIQKLIISTRGVSELYRKLIMGDTGYSMDEIVLIDNNFESEFKNYYNEFTIKDCSDGHEDGFFATVTKAIQGIWDKTKWGLDGIKEWREAWALLIGSSSEEKYHSIEREILLDELSRQGLDSDQAIIIMGNLDESNNSLSDGGSPYTPDNNPITNSFTTMMRNLKDDIDSFGEAVRQVKENMSGEEEDINIGELSRIKVDIQSSEDIGGEISKLYDKTVTLSAHQNTNTEKVIAKLLRTHIELSQGINSLYKASKVSETVCNQQDRGAGRCEY